MKSLIKKLSLGLIIIIILAMSFGCSNPEEPTKPTTPDDVVIDKDPKEEEPKVEEPKVEESKEKEPNSIVIEATDKVDIEGLSLLSSYDFDIDGNGNEETVSLYTTAERHENGDIIWDDGQNWKLLVEGTDKDYILFDDHVQLGSIKFHAYTSEDEFYITTIQVGTATLKLTEYHFDKESKNFTSNIRFETTGNVNMLYQSSGY